MTTSPPRRVESVLRNADFNRLWTAVGAFLAVIPLVVTPVRTLRDMPTPAEET